MNENLFVEAQYRTPQGVDIAKVFSELVNLLEEHSGSHLIDLDAGLDASQKFIYFSAEILKDSSKNLETTVKDELSKIMKTVLGEDHEPELISITLDSGDQKLIGSL